MHPYNVRVSTFRVARFLTAWHDSGGANVSRIAKAHLKHKSTCVPVLPLRDFIALNFSVVHDACLPVLFTLSVILD